eukprot:gene6424-8842_t
MTLKLNNIDALNNRLAEHLHTTEYAIYRNKILETITDVANLNLSDLCRSISEKSIELCSNVFRGVYLDTSTEFAKEIVKKSVANITPSALTYGEIEYFAFLNILQRAKPKKGESFYDLGHGTGKAIIAADLHFGYIFASISGIEIIPELYEISLLKLKFYEETISSDSFCEYFDRNENRSIIKLLNVSFMDELEDDWTNADIIFANSTCFDNDLMEKIALKAEKLRQGSRFISFTRPLPSENFQVIEERQYGMSWGVVTSFIQIRL